MTEIPDDNHIKRTADGRPYIKPVGDGKPRPYTRTSTFSRALDDGTALMGWKQRMLLKGCIENPGMLTNAHLDPLEFKVGNAAVETLMDLAGANDAANFGTGAHNLAWLLDFKADDTREVKDNYNLSPEYSRWLDRYKDLTGHLDMIEGETFVVNDLFGCAGTFDRLVRLPDGRVLVADIKTGKDLHPQQFAIQMAVYATSSRYDTVTGERTPMHPDLDPTVGMVIHVPQERDGMPALPGSLPGLDLVVGLELASLALKVRKSRTAKVAADPFQPREVAV